MANCEQNRNPLKRSGTSQKQRQLPGMLPDYVLIDERQYSDWLVFAVEFSKYLKYYDSATGYWSGNWKPFFQSDISALLGSIGVQNIETYRTNLKERMNYIKDNDNEGYENKLRSKLNEIFSGVCTLAKALDNHYLQLTDETPFKATLNQLIKVKLAPAYRRLIAYYKGADDRSLLRKFGNEIQWRILGLELTDAEILLDESLSDIWWTSAEPNKASVTPNDSIYGDVTWTIFRQISHAANHHLFASAVEVFTGTYAKIIAEAEKHLLATLENLDTHTPHYTLFLTFLKLFKNVQSQINGLTWRHLDFYYKEVLQLKSKEAIPDRVHLVAELAKHADSAALPEGTLFKAGKDSEGKEVVYALDDETTFNKAKVALFKALYKGNKDGSDDIKTSGGTLTTNNKGRLYAAPVIDSADGAGEKLKTENREWHPLVIKEYDDEARLSSINMPVAEVGFALASHYLFLSEGMRKIRIRFDATGSALLTAKFVCYLTTEKEWLEISPTSITASNFSSTAANCTEILLDIPATAPAITAYNAEVHGGTYSTDVPIVKCVIVNETDTGDYDYDALKNITISQTEIKVEAGGINNTYNQDGIKDLLLANQNGALDASKSFMPFGAIPTKDMSLVIGNKELFSKKNSSFNLNVAWADRPASLPSSPSATLQFLEGGKWNTKAGANLTGSKICYSSSHVVFTGMIPVTNNSTVDYEEAYENYNSSSRAGFMRLLLGGNFGHDNYNTTLTLHLIDQAKEEPTGSPALPAEPYTPIIESLYLSYASYSDIVTLSSKNEDAFEDRPIQFFHVGPFGEAERNANLSDKDTSIHLIPRLEEYDTIETDEGGNSVPGFAAEWYIGIENLAGNQSVNILFQLMEGSTNPLISKPEKHVHWSYLANNHWEAFDDRQIDDSTRQLINSGIISFSIPGDATTDNTILPEGYLWLKAAVSEAADAVCKVLSVQAQAMVASYLPDNNAADFLDTALPAGTISKLKSPNALFKKIEQPYSSFGGRQKESSKQFYQRSSERLRHKGRAITIWDYEHLVLEAFPQLHKVKCLNHTQVEDNPDASKSVYNETRPGYVSIITIPDLINRNDTNPLQPYTNQNLLTEIREFLEKRISAQVKVNVCNPQFEEVRIEFKLQLRDGYDDFTYYSKLLKEEITQYLSPWAYNLQTEVQFGGKISKSQLIDFIEERDYVDFITEVKLYHKPGPTKPEGTEDVEEVAATTARSILVSAPASKHVITVYEAKATTTQKECDYI